jgi:hypothetical protein
LYNIYDRKSIYLLGVPVSDLPKDDPATEYSLCSMQAGLLPHCHTELNLVGNSSVMIAHCNETNDEISYSKHDNSAVDTVSTSWVAVGSLAATSVAFNLGETLDYADNPQILTKLILSSPNLAPNEPSIAEGLAAMLMPSLVMAAQNSPFEMSWVNPHSPSTRKC